MLVKAYNELQQAIPGRFEVIFVSSDTSELQQDIYAREAAMPWPVLHYRDLGQIPLVEGWAGRGIPDLVAITRDGYLIFNSYRGDEYLGADSVLDAFKNLVPMFDEKSPAIKRDRHRLAIAQRRVEIGSGSSAPAPYLTPFNPKHYQTLEEPEVTLSLKINEQGKVTDVQIQPDLPVVLKDSLNRDVTDWLFLPAIESGQLKTRTVSLPLKFSRPKKATASDSQ
jgi:hypothetical protein